MEALKKYWLDVAVVALFAVISFAYFMPADLEGRILYRHDSAAGRGMGHEQQEYLLIRPLRRTPAATLWVR